MSTDTGRALIAAVAPELQNPVLTAGMERALSQVADGSMTLEAFMARMEQLVAALVGTAVAQGQDGNGEAAVGAVTRESVKACPQCGKPMHSRQGKYGPFLGCSGYPKCKHIERPGKGPAPVKTDKACRAMREGDAETQGEEGVLSRLLRVSGVPAYRVSEMMSN